MEGGGRIGREERGEGTAVGRGPGRAVRGEMEEVGGEGGNLLEKGLCTWQWRKEGD